MYFERKRFTGEGVEVGPGARSRHHSNAETLSFRYFAVCDSVDPEVWHGEVTFGSAVLLSTGSAPDEHTAGRQAEAEFQARVITLLGTA